MTRSDLRTSAIAILLLLLQAGVVAAERDERRGGEVRGGEAEERRPDEGSYERQPEDDGTNSDTTRRGGSVDTDETTDGDTTTRDTTVTGADGRSADHTGTVDRDGDTTTYRGETDTSTGRESDAAGEVRKTDDGFVGRGAAVGDRGAAAGGVVKDGDQVEGRGITTDGTSVDRNAVDCVNGDCNRAAVDTRPVTYGAAVPDFVPYSSYPCPGGTDMVPSPSGDIVYSCAVTPVVAATVPLTTGVPAAGGAATSAQVTSAAVVMYQVAPDVVVYATSYQPQGVYCQDINRRCYWIPGVAAASPDVLASLEAAAAMQQPTANATVITYIVGGNLVYFTGEPPARGIYSQSGNSLYAWMPGVTQPTEAQRGAIATSVTVHGQQGARVLADEARRAKP